MDTYTLTLTQPEIQTIALGLGELPFKLSAALLSNIQAQIKKQEMDATTSLEASHE
jgi:hypothetical protein